MNTLSLLALGFVAVSSIATAQTYLSPRVGNEIDRVEKEYFGLFPMINGFVSAKATPQSEQITAFTITTLFEGRRKDTSMLVDARSMDKLSKYMDNFESIRMKENTVNWSVFKGIAAESPASNNLFHDPLEATVEALDGTSVTGKLLWAEDSSLVVWRSDTPYNWKTVAQDASVLRVETIKSIRVERQGGFGSGARFGAYAGLAGCLIIAGINYKDIQIHNVENAAVYAFAGGAIIALSAIVCGVVGSDIQQDLHAKIDGNVKKYQQYVDSLSNSSIIESYPPPELVRLINK